jgi:hypothetical protein
MSGEFRVQVVGNVQTRRAEAEITAQESGDTVAAVWESAEGWHIELLAGEHPLDAFNAAVVEAKSRLTHYVNRRGENPPKDLTPAGLSLWLMLKDDGPAMEKRL